MGVNESRYATSQLDLAVTIICVPAGLEVSREFFFFKSYTVVSISSLEKFRESLLLGVIGMASVSLFLLFARWDVARC